MSIEEELHKTSMLRAISEVQQFNKGYLAGLRRAWGVCRIEEERLLTVRLCSAFDDSKSLLDEKLATAARCMLEIEDVIRTMTQGEKA